MTLPDRIRKNNTATIIYNMMPVSQKGLKELLGVSRDAISRAFRLLKEHKLVYISGYDPSKNTHYPVYSKGDLPDMPKPTARQLENARRQRWRLKNKDKEHAKQQNYRKRNREMLNNKQKAYYAANKETIRVLAKMKTAKPATKTRWVEVKPWETA